MSVIRFLEQLPRCVRVGPYDYAITICKLPDIFGRFNSIDQTIEISDINKTKIMAVDTLMHEINHAIIWANAVSLSDEESIVSGITPGWTQVYRDNPWLLDWIKRGLR